MRAPTLFDAFAGDCLRRGAARARRQQDALTTPGFSPRRSSVRRAVVAGRRLWLAFCLVSLVALGSLGALVFLIMNR